MSVRYALSSTRYSCEFRAKFATLCCAFANASDSVRHADSRIWREVRMNSSLSFHSQEQWHCWLPDPKATHVRKRFRPAGHTDATAQSGTGRHVTLYVPSSSAGATPGDAFPQPPLHLPPQTPWSSQTPWRGRGPRPTSPPSSAPSPCCGPSPRSHGSLTSRDGSGQGRSSWRRPGRSRWRRRMGSGSRPSKCLSPMPSRSPTPGEGGRRGRRLLPSTHPGCVEGTGDWIVARRVGRGCRRGS